MHDRIPHSRMVRFEHSAHLTMIDDTGDNNDEVGAFLMEVDQNVVRSTLVANGGHQHRHASNALQPKS
jgi:hypothetical protein